LVESLVDQDEDDQSNSGASEKSHVKSPVRN
jgi:hypothetical protein